MSIFFYIKKRGNAKAKHDWKKDNISEMELKKLVLRQKEYQSKENRKVIKTYFKIKFDKK